MGDVFLSGPSALRFWRRYREYGCSNSVSPSRAVPKGPRPSRMQIEDARHLLAVVDDPIHIDVSGSADRGIRSGQVAHSPLRSEPKPVYCRVCQGVYTADRVTMFIQMGRYLSLAQHIALGFELCGSYVLSDSDARGFCAVDPLISAARLRRATDRHALSAGRKQARRASSYVLDDSASPRETISAMLLTLPYGLGGMNLKGAELNGIINLDERQQSSLGRKFLKADILWRKEKVVLEYESRMFHSDPVAYVRDSRRRNDLASLGFDVVTLTNDELRSFNYLDSVIAGLHRKLHRRYRCTRADHTALRRALHKELVFRHI